MHTSPIFTGPTMSLALQAQTRGQQTQATRSRIANLRARANQLQLNQQQTQATITQPAANINTVNLLAKSVASKACDEGETKNAVRKLHRQALSNQIEPAVNQMLIQIVNRFNRPGLDVEMTRLIGYYASRIAWRLRHGHSFKISHPSTWLLYWGEVSETGINKIASPIYNVTHFWKKPYFIKPKPLTATQMAEMDALIDEAITEVSNDKLTP